MVFLSSANGDDVGVWVYCGGVYYGVLLLWWWRFWFIAVMFIVMLVVVCPAHVYGSVVVVGVLMFLMVVYSFGDGVLWCLRFCALVVVVVVIFMMVVCS